MVITELATSEVHKLPSHTVANIIYTIDNINSSICKNKHLQLNKNLYGIKTRTNKIPRTIFIYDASGVEIIVGILMNQYSKLTPLEIKMITERTTNMKNNDKLFPWNDLKKTLLQDPNIYFHHENETINNKLIGHLLQWRDTAQMNKKEVAEKMHVTYTYLCQLERKPIKASILTIHNYAKACGVDEINIII
ncbi:TPA: helix-turn-helix domain-containing protein [Citrobacter freundii]|nr:helix-turn-helix transcriptional regulator [Citrobacter freundii]EKV4364368.1 helix-turn-helix transcriptional regulator [Citrobacter freundii]HDT6516664.1 helix-turn-helix transcriptional regulator [Citrobacter freundii]